MKRFSLSFLFSFIIVSLAAQISYYNGKLDINGGPYHPFAGLNINNWAGMQWVMGQNRLQLDMSSISPRLSGTRDRVVFFNTLTKTYNTIEVDRVLRHVKQGRRITYQPISGLEGLSVLRPAVYGTNPMIPAANKMRSSVPAITTDSVDTSLQYVSDFRCGFEPESLIEFNNYLPNFINYTPQNEMLVDYEALIPVLVQSIQELQANIEAQSIIISELSNQKARTAADNPNRIVACSPNPADTEVSITVSMETGVLDGNLHISDIYGNRELTAAVSSTSPTVTEDISALPAGVHIVTLYVGETMCDSYRLVIKR